MGVEHMLKKSKVLGVLVLLIVSAVSSNVLGATVHLTGYSAVDSGEIRYGGTSKYSTQLSSAISSWHNLGPVDILPDNLSTVEDVTFYDVYSSNSYWDGRYVPTAGSDSIQLNTYFIDGYTSTNKQGVICHEIGHALGLGEHDDNSYYNNSVMWYQTTNRFVYKPASHDVVDYERLY